MESSYSIHKIIQIALSMATSQLPPTFQDKIQQIMIIAFKNIQILSTISKGYAVQVEAKDYGSLSEIISFYKQKSNEINFIYFDNTMKQTIADKKKDENFWTKIKSIIEKLNFQLSIIRQKNKILEQKLNCLKPAQNTNIIEAELIESRIFNYEIPKNIDPSRVDFMNNTCYGRVRNSISQQKKPIEKNNISNTINSIMNPQMQYKNQMGRNNIIKSDRKQLLQSNQRQKTVQKVNTNTCGNSMTYTNTTTYNNRNYPKTNYMESTNTYNRPPIQNKYKNEQYMVEQQLKDNQSEKLKQKIKNLQQELQQTRISYGKIKQQQQKKIQQQNIKLYKNQEEMKKLIRELDISQQNINKQKKENQQMKRKIQQLQKYQNQYNNFRTKKEQFQTKLSQTMELIKHKSKQIDTITVVLAELNRKKLYLDSNIYILEQKLNDQLKRLNEIKKNTRINSFMIGQVLQNEIDRQYVIEQVQRLHPNKKMKKTKILFIFPLMGQMLPHETVDEKPDYIILIKSKNICQIHKRNYVVAMYSQKPLINNGVINGGLGFVSAVTNQRTYYLNKSVHNSTLTEFAKYSFVFDCFVLNFQNKIPKFQVNLNKNKYFITGYATTNETFIGRGAQTNKSQIVEYEVHQIFWEDK